MELHALPNVASRPSGLQKTLAWTVHFYTSLGLVLAAMSATLIARGDGDSLRWALVLLLSAVIIDATDGFMARLVQVQKVLPKFDGRRLDEIVDFSTYVFLPLLLLWRADTPVNSVSWCLLFPLLASAYGFCHVDAKTRDGYFLGFPSCWNFVVFYLFLLQPPAWVSAVVIISLSVLTFIPLRYLYPTQKGFLNRVACCTGFIWLGVLMFLAAPTLPYNPISPDPENTVLIYITLIFPLFYLSGSWLVNIQKHLNNRPISPIADQGSTDNELLTKGKTVHSSSMVTEYESTD